MNSSDPRNLPLRRGPLANPYKPTTSTPEDRPAPAHVTTPLVKRNIFFIIFVGLLLNNATVSGMKRKRLPEDHSGDRALKRRKRKDKIPTPQDLKNVIYNWSANNVEELRSMATPHYT